RHLLLRLHAPELKALFVDRLLDGGAGKFVRRFPIRAEDARRMPRSVLPRKPAALRIAPEGAQLGLPVGFEHEDTHPIHLSFFVTELQTPGALRSAAAELLARRRTAGH